MTHRHLRQLLRHARRRAVQPKPTTGAALMPRTGTTKRGGIPQGGPESPSAVAISPAEQNTIWNYIQRGRCTTPTKPRPQPARSPIAFVIQEIEDNISG
jgi:hypothetical protein